MHVVSIMVQMQHILHFTCIVITIGYFTQQGYGMNNSLPDLNATVLAAYSHRIPYNNHSPQCNCICGTPQRQGKVIGGKKSSILKYPWMVRLFMHGGHVCGGTLINDKYVLTAAHCFHGIVDVSKIAVAIGEQNYCKYSKIPIPEKTLGVLRWIPGNFDMESLDNDIALIELVDRVQFTKATQPICMPTGSDNILANAVLAGWGKWHDYSRDTCELNELNVQILEPKYCKIFKTPGSTEITRKSLICAGFKTSMKGPCHGDSGGPLMRLMYNERFRIIGITSYVPRHERPGSCGYPSVFTKVFEYLTWIKENTKNACYCSD